MYMPTTEPQRRPQSPALSTMRLSSGQITTIVLAIVCVLVVLELGPRWWFARRNRREMAKWREEMQIIRSTYPEYTYERLLDPQPKNIRLIELLPANDDMATIEIRIETISLLDLEHRQYEAISYCWGDPTDPQPISCPNDSLLWITDSLFDALNRFRLQDRSRWLWADAVCINQSDNEEKSVQVSMMEDIYRKASRVLVWLGEEADNSGLVEDFVPRLLQARQRMKRYSDMRSYQELRREEIREYGIPFVEKDYQNYKALNGVVKRPWFTRTWIIQEIALAREAVVCCGKWEILWSSLAEAWDFAEVLRIAGFFQLMSGSRSGSTVVDLDETVAAISSDKRLPLIELLCHHSHAQVTDERDRVFALKGIVSEPDTIQVDYDKPMIRVFWDTALAVINKSRNLDVLSEAAVRPTPTDPDWPSWVPAWHQGYHAIPMTNYIRDFGHCASRNSSYSPIMTSEGNRIQLRGYELDWITEIGALTTGHRFRDSGWTFSADRSAWADWSRMCGAFTDKSYGPTGEPMLDVFRAILTRGTLTTFPSSGDPVHDMEILESWIRVASFLQGPRFFRKLWLYDAIVAMIVLSWTILLQAIGFGHRIPPKMPGNMLTMLTSGRSMVKTSQGFLGLSNGSLEKDDQVFLLEGATVPYVLRKTAENVYVLVGDAYIHGCMSGEQWDQEKCRTISLA